MAAQCKAANGPAFPWKCSGNPTYLYESYASGPHGDRGEDGPRAEGPPLQRARASSCIRKGTHGVSTNGVTANFRLSYFYLPKSARAYLFPQFVKIHYLCSGPISVDPIRPQPMHAAACEKADACIGFLVCIIDITSLLVLVLLIGLQMHAPQ